MKRYSLLALFAIFALILSACRGVQPTANPAPLPEPTKEQKILPTNTAVTNIDVNALYNVTWALVSYGDPQNPTVLPPSLNITANFDAENNLTGSGGCNQYFAKYTARSDGSMNITGQIGSTMMACEQTQMDAETAYLAGLQAVKGFNFTPDGNLVLTYLTTDKKEGRMTFKVGAVPLAGTQWVLVSYGDPKNPVMAQQATPVTALFTEGDTANQGTVSGSASCNSYSASYSVNGGQIQIGPAAVTMKVCQSGTDQESAYLNALAMVQTYQISGQTLSITYDDGKGVLTYTSASLPLASTLWTLNSIDGVPLPTDISITALFTPAPEGNNGTLSGLAACNNYSASYTQNAQSDPPGLTVTMPATTMMMCDETTMQAQQNYLTQIQAAQSYQILGGTLTINTQSGGHLVYVASRTPLTGALWQLVALGDVTKPVAPVQGANFTAQFTRNASSQTGVISGTTGCNQYAAPFTASVTEMNIDLPGSTQNGTCAPGLTDQEKLYYLALDDVSSYVIQGNTLIMPYDSGKQELVFQAGQMLTAPPQPLSNLNNTLWYLWYLNDQAPVNGSTVSGFITIKSDGSGGRMEGSAGCNTYIADFGLNIGVQTTLNSGTTCTNPPGVMDFENKYMSALSRAYGFWLTGDQLIINTGAGPLIYHQTPPLSANDQAYLLVNKNWYLISYNANYSSAGTQEPFTRFNTDGTLNGFTGCNNFNGQWKSAPGMPWNTLQISGLSSTKAACPNQVLTNQETSMLAILGAAQTFRVAGNSLQIVASNGNLNYSLVPLTRPEEVTPPKAIIVAPSQAQVNQTVTFDGSRSTSGAPITSWRWDFGDGGRGTGPVVQHVYTKAADYRVQMTVDDQLGRVNSTAWTIKITPLNVPTPTPTAVPTATATSALTSVPTNAPTNVPTLAPTATFTPPAKPTDSVPPAPTNTNVAPTNVPPTQPPAPTDTSVPPTVEPTLPPTPTPTEEPTAIPPTPTPVPTQPPSVPPTAAVQGPPSGFVGEPVTFSAAASQPGSSPIQSYSWNFGDGVSVQPTGTSGAQATHLFNRGGTYQVSVVVTDANGLSSSATTQVTINARLNTTVWGLMSGSSVTPAPGTSITLQFQNGQIAGFAGCNSYTGSYSATDNGDGTYTITAGSITTSKQTCPNNVMEVESAYISALQQVTTASVQGGTLVLNYAGGSLRYNQLYNP